MKIVTYPVWSKLAADVPPEVEACLPIGIRLSHHQAKTYHELTAGHAQVIFNTAMTGDGKSLAAQLPALIHGGCRPLLAMYPTNELVRDQLGQITRSQQQWGADLVVNLLDSKRLDEIMLGDLYGQRGDAILSVAQNSDVVLTNPDIFYLIMHLFYRRAQDAPDKVIRPLMQKFGQLTFDEFHVFEIPQVVSVLNALLLIDEIAGDVRPHRYLFLSATPGDKMLEYLHRSGLSVQEIQGKYLHTKSRPDPDQWRPILSESTIRFAKGKVEQWVDEHLDDVLLPFFLEHRPGAKGAMIVNSVAAANRLVDRLGPELAKHGLCVAPNTGMTSRSGRADSYEADLLVGTSTVDVGVDFQINFLVFESQDAGTFLQRLGRLGRHAGYVRDGKFYPFEQYEAHALVPAWVAETLFDGHDGAAPLLEENGWFDREELTDAIKEAYPSTARFDAYTQLWGELQTARIMSGLSHPTVREQYTGTRARLGPRYEAAFGIRMRGAFGRYKELAAEQPALVQEAEAFRGGSYFDCCVLDDKEKGQERFKTTDLFLLLANVNTMWVGEEVFYLAAEQAGLARTAFKRFDPIGFFRMFGWRKEREDYGIFIDRDIRSWSAERFGRAVALTGFKIDADVPWLAEVNRRLSPRHIPALLCLGYHPLELKRLLRLPLLFPVQAFCSRDGLAGSVAFGREALMLEAQLHNYRLDCGGDMILV